MHQLKASYAARVEIIETVESSLESMCESSKMPSRIKVKRLGRYHSTATYGAPFNQGFAGLRLAIVQTIILKAYSFHRTRHLASGKLERYTCIC